MTHAQTKPDISREKDRAAIEQTMAKSMDAWNKHDAHAFALSFAPDADFTNVRGAHAQGREAVESFHAPVFAGIFKDSHLTCKLRSVRFLAAGLAAVDVDWNMTGARSPGGTVRPVRSGLLDWIMSKQKDGSWLILVMHNTELTDFAAPPPAMESAREADEVAIHSVISAQTEAWNRGDAKAFSQRFQQDGGLTNILGMVIYGRDGFEQRVAEIFKTIFRGSTFKQTIRRTHFVRPDVAVVDVDTEMTGYQALPPGVRVGADGVLRTRLQQVMVKEKGEWWVAAYHNVDLKPLPPRP